MTGWTSAAPAAVLALVAAAQSIQTSPSTPEVHDSLIVTASAAQELIVVAGGIDFDNPSDQAFIDHQLPQPGYRDQQEAFTVFSQIGVLSGGSDIASPRARCYEILRDWTRAIEDDQTLGAAVISAWVSSVAWRPQQVEGGSLAVLVVGVDCEAITEI